jgi:hypothetical protein
VRPFLRNPSPKSPAKAIPFDSFALVLAAAINGKNVGHLNLNSLLSRARVHRDLPFYQAEPLILLEAIID